MHILFLPWVIFMMDSTSLYLHHYSPQSVLYNLVTFLSHPLHPPSRPICLTCPPPAYLIYPSPPTSVSPSPHVSASCRALPAPDHQS